MDDFSAPHFCDDTAAREYIEKLLWPEGPVCPYCGVINRAYETKRPGVFRCAENSCREEFTVTMKTIMERSQIALHKWLQAFHLVCGSNVVSVAQLHRLLDLDYETAWFLVHRIKESTRRWDLEPSASAMLPPLLHVVSEDPRKV